MGERRVMSGSVGEGCISGCDEKWRFMCWLWRKGVGERGFMVLAL